MTTPFEQERKKLQQQRMKAIHDANQLQKIASASPASNSPTSSDTQSVPSPAQPSSAPMDTEAPSVESPSPPSMPTTEQPTTSSGVTVVPNKPAPIVPLSTATTTSTPAPTDDDEVDGDLIIDVPNGPRLGAQIKLDIGRISGQVSDSGLRSLIGGFQRVVSPHFKDDGDSHFPRTHKPHPIHAERAAQGGFGNVLLFHIGRAIEAYYCICNDEATQLDLDAIARLHKIAQNGATSYVSLGNDGRGYTLEPSGSSL